MSKRDVDVINYRPDLKVDYVPSVSILDESSISKETVINVKNVNLTFCLEEFKDNSPSSSIASLEDAIESIRLSMNDMVDKMSSTKVGKEYVNATTDEEKKSIIESNYTNPCGSTYIEAYVELSKLNDELVHVMNDYILYTYGEELDYEKAKSIDDNFIVKAEALESDFNKKDINYTSLYYETMISYLIESYVYNIMDSVYPYMSGINEECQDMPFNDKYRKVLINNFEKKQKLLQNDICKDRKTTYNIRVALKNAFLALQDYEDSLGAIDCSDILLKNEELGLEIKGDMLSNLADALLVLIHALYYSSVAKTDISNSLRVKSEVRKYFIEKL